MCNNNVRFCIPKKKLKKDFKDWRVERPILKENVKAKEKSVKTKQRISYDEAYPLMLHDGTKIYGIGVVQTGKAFKTIAIEYLLNDSQETNTAIIKRLREDQLGEVEQFLENSMSIYQLRNIDMKMIENEQD